MNKERFLEIIKLITPQEMYELICVGRNCDTCLYELLNIDCCDFKLNKEEI